MFFSKVLNWIFKRIHSILLRETASICNTIFSVINWIRIFWGKRKMSDFLSPRKGAQWVELDKCNRVLLIRTNWDQVLFRFKKIQTNRVRIIRMLVYNTLYLPCWIHVSSALDSTTELEKRLLYIIFTNTAIFSVCSTELKIYRYLLLYLNIFCKLNLNY